MIQCYLTENDCYKAGRKITPKGVMVHSTGANNPYIKRYVQPDTGGIGENKSRNDWNRPGVQKCVHAFVGKLENGAVEIVQTLPWNMRGWHAGGSANNTHIGFEICEDGLLDRGYFEKVYAAAAELCAQLCKAYKLDPLKDGVLICHSEGHKRGIASNHADVLHWWPKFGKDMDDFRADVQRRMEEESMTYEDFKTYMNRYLSELADAPMPKEVQDWAAAEWAQAQALGITDGSSPMGLVPRYQAAIMAKRAAQQKQGK